MVERLSAPEWVLAVCLFFGAAYWLYALVGFGPRARTIE